MSEGSLFNSGFLGASFNWWVGQIADDSTWRDNILPGKFESANDIPGWGRRYKVRIIGLHDQGETEIASDQLPWAQVMYPVTTGGGQGKSGATPNLRQGNMVFGFFLDGQEQQVPVIMGVLGNNAQTQLSTKIGDNKVTNTQPGSLATSGYAEPANGNKDFNIRAPDEGLVVKKPTPQGTPSATPKPGVVLDKFGRDPSRPPTRAELNAAQSARAESDRLGETGAVREARIANATVAATRQEASAAASPASPAVPGATIENVDAVHLQSNADTKRLDLYLKKTVMLSPCDLPGSAMKGMQTEIDNLTKEIDKILQAAQSYVDAASQILSDIAALIADFACIIAKYMKIIFDKIFEYILKQINKAMSSTVDIMFPNQRNQYLDIKEIITELIKCLYSKITGNLCGQIQGFLNDILDTQNPSLDGGVGGGVGGGIGGVGGGIGGVGGGIGGVGGGIGGGIGGIFNRGTSPFVPICAVETLTGSVIASNMGDVNNTVNDIVTSINTFLTDIQDGISLVTGDVGSTSIGGIAFIGTGNVANVTFVANVTNNSADIIGTSPNNNLILGMVVSITAAGILVPDGTTIVSIAGNIVTLSNVVTGSAENAIINARSVIGQIGSVTGQIGSIIDQIGGLSQISGIVGSITSALSFENITLDIFGCDLKPNCAASDFYTLQEGAGAAEEAQLPRPAEVNKLASRSRNPITSPIPPFATPAKNTRDFDSRADASTQRQIEERTAGFA